MRTSLSDIQVPSDSVDFSTLFNLLVPYDFHWVPDMCPSYLYIR